MPVNWPQTAIGEAMMILGMILMFVIETGCLVVAAWLIWKRLAAYLKDNPEGVAALTTHLFIPLLGKRKKV